MIKKTNSKYAVNEARAMYDLGVKLLPFNRSITGEGIRKTLKEISKILPLTVHAIPTGTKIFDWEVPEEWDITGAYIKNSKGEKVLDFKNNNLHVVSYSMPVKAALPLKKLKDHLFTIPDHPDWIPYRTAYYNKGWGFCMTHNQFMNLKEDLYEVTIDSTLKKGELNYGEFLVKGKKEDEILISTHICHPSLFNDNLSGLTLAVHLAKKLLLKKTKYSYRFVFIPGTIGSIAWLSQNEKNLNKIKGGFVLSGVGDSGNIHYKKSRKGDTIMDNAFVRILGQKKGKSKILDFSPFGYDERQYCSPGFNLPVGCLTRSVFGTYPQYHTSADNADFVKQEYLEDTFITCLDVIEEIETEPVYLNLNPKCEPQLGKRGLYRAMNAQTADKKNLQMALLWVLNYSDGTYSLRTIAAKSNMKYSLLQKAADMLIHSNLLKKIN